MSCFELNISRIGDGIDVASSRIGEGIVAEVGRAGKELQTEVREIGGRLVAKAASILEGITVRCSIVCTLEEVGHYLDVTPADIQWITDDMGVFYDVESNVEWKILIG